MTYLLLCAGFLAAAAAILVIAITLTKDRGAFISRWAGAVALAAVVLLVLTAVFDNLMIAAGLFAYEPEHISGILIGRAPIEDFAYPLAAVLLLPALWMLIGTRERRRHAS
ncbi:MAG: lycopene cyclase domain-containing protein [Microbacteriaceae bacterium]